MTFEHLECTKYARSEREDGEVVERIGENTKRQIGLIGKILTSHRRLCIIPLPMYLYESLWQGIDGKRQGLIYGQAYDDDIYICTY